MFPGALSRVLRKISGSLLRGTVGELVAPRPLTLLLTNISETGALILLDMWARRRVRGCAESLCVLCGVRDRESSTQAASYSVPCTLGQQPQVTLTTFLRKTG